VEKFHALQVHPWAATATDQPAHPSARGAQGGRETSCYGNHSSAWGSRLEISFGPAFRVKVSIDKLTYAIALLCVRCDRSNRRAPEPCNELPPFHSITSAIASRRCGTSRPSSLAAFRLMTKLNLEDLLTGRLAGVAPLRISPTKLAATRTSSA
jgi:hypothetical protein